MLDARPSTRTERRRRTLAERRAQKAAWMAAARAELALHSPHHRAERDGHHGPASDDRHYAWPCTLDAAIATAAVAGWQAQLWRDPEDALRLSCDHCGTATSRWVVSRRDASLCCFACLLAQQETDRAGVGLTSPTTDLAMAPRSADGTHPVRTAESSPKNHAGDRANLLRRLVGLLSLIHRINQPSDKE